MTHESQPDGTATNWVSKLLASKDTPSSSGRRDLRPLSYTSVAQTTHGKGTNREGAAESGSNAARSRFARTNGLARSYPRATPKRLRGRIGISSEKES